jgi:hypothetical protein
VPLDILNVPSVSSEDPFLSTLYERPNSRVRVITRSLSGEKLSTYGFSMYRPCSKVVHVGLEIPDDSGLVCRRDVWTCGNNDIMRLEPEDSFQVELPHNQWSGEDVSFLRALSSRTASSVP